jgi:hypothetical protein
MIESFLVILSLVDKDKEKQTEGSNESTSVIGSVGKRKVFRARDVGKLQ